MRYLLKNMLRPLYVYFNSKNQRVLSHLQDKWSGHERYKAVVGVRFLNYTIDVPDIPSFIGQFKELFVDEIYKFDFGNDKPVIFDCGANIGISCLYFKSLYQGARIIAFEADKEISQFLSKNLHGNGIKDVEIINKAVWVNNEGVEFSVDGADGGSIGESDNMLRVESIRLKDALEREKSQIDLLKIDIEGAELEVLQDCRCSIKNVKNIFIEYHSWNKSEQKLSEILQILEENDFRYYIEGISYRATPFINKGLDQNMDLQLNIFGVKNR